MHNKQKYSLSLDVGGTSIKSAIVADDGEILHESYCQTSIDSKGSLEEIIGTFSKVIAESFKLAKSTSIEIAGIGIGMPGPFDYENGISYIKDVDKYEAIYGVNLKKELRQRIDFTDDFPIFFENDAWAFVRGEAWQGAGKGFHRIIGLTMGTGLGSGFMVDDEMVDSGRGIPPLAWIGGLRWGDGIVDDRISRRGIIARYRELCHEKSEHVDVKEIAGRAESGEMYAITVFNETGAILGQMLKSVAELFRAECVIIGGKIAYSYPLFESALKAGFQSPIKIIQAKNIEQSALLGASRFLFKQLARFLLV